MLFGQLLLHAPQPTSPVRQRQCARGPRHSNMLYDKSPELLDVAWTLYEAETDNLLRLFKFAPDSI